MSIAAKAIEMGEVQCFISEDKDNLIKETCNISQSSNTTTVTALAEPNLWCITLVLFPITCIFGNVLIVMAVLSERSLKTSTNFLLVSLACADLLVGALVMPFSVYLTVNRLEWYLPEPLCNFFCVVDVSASTSSIVHLVAISIDRFYAVVRHMEYKDPRHKKRVYGTILFSWVFSIGIGLPLGIGLNDGGGSKNEHECGIVNPDYMLYSSIFAFYIPCLVMTIMYSFVFYKLHRRMKAVKLQEMAAGQMVQFGDNLGNILQHAYGNKENLRQASIIWAIPFLKTLEETIAENDDMSTEELDELTTILQTLEADPRNRAIIQTMEDIPESPEMSHANSMNATVSDSVIGQLLSTPRPPRNVRKPNRITNIINSMTATRRRRRRRRLVSKSSTSSGQSISLTSVIAAFTKDKESTVVATNSEGDSLSELSGSGSGRSRSKVSDLRSRSESESERRRSQSLLIAKQKIKTLKDRAIELLMKLKSKQGMAIRKETRATKLVSTVMLVFLLCWTPFFTLNIVKVSKLRTDTWTYELESLFIFFTWLGYLNSCLNPIIYSLFNRKFRATFQKLLHCPSEEVGSPLSRQRRLYSRPFVGDDKHDQRSTWFMLSLGHTYSPRKTGTHIMQQCSVRSEPPTPRNGVFATSTRSLPPADIAITPLVQRNVLATQGEISRRRKITWDMDGQRISTPGLPDRKISVQTIIENTVLRSPQKVSNETATAENPSLVTEQQNGPETALLKKVESFRCPEAPAGPILDFTEPVEV